MRMVKLYAATVVFIILAASFIVMVYSENVSSTLTQGKIRDSSISAEPDSYFPIAMFGSDFSDDIGKDVNWRCALWYNPNVDKVKFEYEIQPNYDDLFKDKTIVYAGIQILIYVDSDGIINDYDDVDCYYYETKEESQGKENWFKHSGIIDTSGDISSSDWNSGNVWASANYMVVTEDPQDFIYGNDEEKWVVTSDGGDTEYFFSMIKAIKDGYNAEKKAYEAARAIQVLMGIEPSKTVTAVIYGIALTIGLAVALYHMREATLDWIEKFNSEADLSELLESPDNVFQLFYFRSRITIEPIFKKEIDWTDTIKDKDDDITTEAKYSTLKNKFYLGNIRDFAFQFDGPNNPSEDYKSFISNVYIDNTPLINLYQASAISLPLNRYSIDYSIYDYLTHGDGDGEYFEYLYENMKPLWLVSRYNNMENSGPSGSIDYSKFYATPITELIINTEINGEKPKEVDPSYQIFSYKWNFWDYNDATSSPQPTLNVYQQTLSVHESTTTSQEDICIDSQGEMVQIGVSDGTKTYKVYYSIGLVNYVVDDYGMKGNPPHPVYNNPDGLEIGDGIEYDPFFDCSILNDPFNRIYPYDYNANIENSYIIESSGSYVYDEAKQFLINNGWPEDWFINKRTSNLEEICRSDAELPSDDQIICQDSDASLQWGGEYYMRVVNTEDRNIVVNFIDENQLIITPEFDNGELSGISVSLYTDSPFNLFSLYRNFSGYKKRLLDNNIFHSFYRNNPNLFDTIYYYKGSNYNDCFLFQGVVNDTTIFKFQSDFISEDDISLEPNEVAFWNDIDTGVMDYSVFAGDLAGPYPYQKAISGQISDSTITYTISKLILSNIGTLPVQNYNQYGKKFTQVPNLEGNTSFINGLYVPT